MRSGCSAKRTGGGSLSWPNCSERLSGRSRNEGEVLRYRREVLRPTREVPGKMGLAAYRRQNRFEGNSDRKSTRLNSSHGYISYAVFCLKKKKIQRVRDIYKGGLVH